MIKNQAYREVYTHLIELGIRLHCRPRTACTAIIYFYRMTVKQPQKLRQYDQYTIAQACLCAAGARENDVIHTAAQDVINVSRKILNPEDPPITIDEERSAGRLSDFDEIRKMFNSPSWTYASLPKVGPHMDIYLTNLRDWQPELFRQYRMEQLCAMIVQDMHVCPDFIYNTTAEVIAALAIHFAVKLISPKIKTSEFITNVCPWVGDVRIHKYRRFIKERVYML